MTEVGDADAEVRRGWLALVPLQSLPSDGTGRVVELAGCRLAVFAIDGGVHVVDDECPHEGASLGDGVVIDGEVTCPWHGWHFQLQSGQNTDGLAACVQVYPTRIGDDEMVEVNLRAARSDSAGSVSE
jgi:nitrite reductase/ring-hydroxylating ferredoxin subunit